MLFKNEAKNSYKCLLINRQGKEFYSPECCPELALAGYLLHHVATLWTAPGKVLWATVIPEKLNVSAEGEFNHSVTSRRTGL